MRCLFAAALLATFTQQLLADKIVLKDGTALEGKIVRETEAEVVFAVHVSDTITDEQTIPRAEIERLEKEAADEIAWQELSALKIDPLGSYALESYDRMVRTLKHFAVKYPESRHADEARQAVDAMEHEQAQVAMGSVKFLGQWLQAEEAAKRRLQINAQHSMAAMRQQAAAGDYVGALNTFDLFEKKFITTRLYPDAVELAQAVLANFERQVARRAKLQAYDQEQFKKVLARAMEPGRSEIIAADQRNHRRDAEAIAAAQRQQLKWPPFIPRSQQSVEILQKYIALDQQRLAVVPTGKMREATAAVDRAKVMLAARNLEGAEEELRNATQLWPQCEEAAYYTKELAAAKAAAGAKR